MAINNLSALAKAVFCPNGVPNLVPEFALIQQDVKFSESEKLGDYYEMPVRLGLPKGVTFAKGDSTAGAFSLNDAIGGSQAKAKVYGYQILLRDQLSLEDAAKMGGSQASFEKAAPFFYEGMNHSIRRYIELECLYGNSGIAVTTGAGTDAGATSHVIAIAAANWADGIWAGSIGDKLQVYTAAPALVSTGTDSVFTVTSVDFTNKTVTVSGSATGITALEAALTGGACKLFFNGAYGNEMAGIHSILTATTGSVFNIAVTDYAQWKGTVYPTTATLNFEKCKAIAARLMAQGGLMEGACVYVSHKNWNDLVDAVIAEHRGKQGDDKIKIGVKEITFTTPAGDLVIKSHAMVWEGFAYTLAKPSKYWKRVGAVDVTSKVPGFGEEMFFTLQSSAGVESRMYTHQAIFTEALAKSGVVSGLVPSANS